MVPNSATHHIFIFVRKYSLNRGRKLNVHKTFRRHPRQQVFYKTQKQPSEVFYNKRCSQKFCENSQENTCAKVSFLDPRRQPEGSYEMGSVRTSVRRSVWPGVYLELYHYFCLNFGMVLETHLKLCMSESDFPEKCFFAPKIMKMGRKQDF